MPLAELTWGDLAYLALSIFLLLTAVTLAYVFLVSGSVLRRLTKLIKRAEDEVFPVVRKVGGTVDRVNAQLDKLDRMTTSAADAVAAADRAVRALSSALTYPIQKLSGLVAGLRYGAAALVAEHDLDAAVRAGREAAARREEALLEELREAEEA